MKVPLRTWVESSKPHMWGIWVSSAAVPAAAAAVNGVFDWLTCLLEALLCWLMLTLACFADEYGDFAKGVDNENRLGPVTPTQRGEIDAPSMKRALVALGLEVALTGIGLLAWSVWRHGDLGIILGFLASGAVCIAAAYLYTLGDHAYGYAGLGDAAGFLFFGLVAGVGGFWLYAHTMDWAVLAPASAVGLLLAASINLNNIRDLDNDAACGKITLAVRLGRRRAVVYHYLLLCSACLLLLVFPIAHGMTHVVRYLFVLAFVPIFNHAVLFARVMDADNPAALKPLMKPLVQGQGMLALAFAICMVVPL